MKLYWRFYGKVLENVGLLLNGNGDMVTKTKEKAKAMNAIFASVFADKNGFHQSQVLETSGKV